MIYFCADFTDNVFKKDRVYLIQGELLYLITSIHCTFHLREMFKNQN